MNKIDIFTALLIAKKAEAIRNLIAREMRKNSTPPTKKPEPSPPKPEINQNNQKQSKTAEINKEEADFLKKPMIQGLDALILAIKTRICLKKQVKEPFLIAGKKYNGVLGLGKNEGLIKKSSHKFSFDLKSQLGGKISLSPIPELTNRQVIQISCGDFHTLALVQGYLPNTRLFSRPDFEEFYDDSTIWGWGENDKGQILGGDAISTVYHPVIIPEFIGGRVQKISAILKSSACLTDFGYISLLISREIFD